MVEDEFTKTLLFIPSIHSPINPPTLPTSSSISFIVATLFIVVVVMGEVVVMVGGVMVVAMMVGVGVMVVEGVIVVVGCMVDVVVVVVMVMRGEIEGWFLEIKSLKIQILSDTVSLLLHRGFNILKNVQSILFLQF